MRVLLVSSLFHPHRGGAERQARALAGALTSGGFEVVVLTTRVVGTPVRDDLDGIAVRRSIRTVALGPLWGLSYMMTALTALLGLRRRYDVIHCQQLYLHTPVAVAVQLFLAKPVLVRLACTGMYGDVHGMQHVALGGPLCRLSARAKRFVALSREGIDEAASIGVPRERIELIPNAVTLAIPEIGDAPAGSSAFVLFVGRLRRQKGVDTLLRAHSRLGVGHELCVVGGGPEWTALHRLTRDLGIEHRVRFVGEVDDPSAYYASASVFVLPSRGEGLSNALLEAMAFGLPVVASRVGGSVDVVEDGVNGMLVDVDDPDQLADAVRRLLEDRPWALSLGARAREAVLRMHTMERVVDRYVEVYRSMLER